MGFFCDILHYNADEVTANGCSHSSVGGFVDHHRLSAGVHVVVHAKVGCHAV